MKKKIIVLISCILLITVSFFKVFTVHADQTDYLKIDFRISEYHDTLLSNWGHTYEFDLYLKYLRDWDLNQEYYGVYQIDWYVRSNDEYMEDYQDFGVDFFVTDSTTTEVNFPVYTGAVLNNSTYNIYQITTMDLSDEYGLHIRYLIRAADNSRLIVMNPYYINDEADREIFWDYWEINDEYLCVNFGLEYYEDFIDYLDVKYEAAYHLGYENGTDHGLSIAPQYITASSFMGEIFDGFDTIFQTEIFGGLTIGVLLFIPLALTVLFGILKIFKR